MAYHTIFCNDLFVGQVVLIGRNPDKLDAVRAYNGFPLARLPNVLHSERK